MSNTNVLRKPADATVRQATPGGNWGQHVVLGLDGNSGGSAQRRIFMYFAGLPPVGAGVVSATLDVYLRGAWTGGPHTVTLQRILAGWKEDKITWNNQPSSSATNQVTQAITGGVDKQKVTFDVAQLVRDMLSANQPYGFRFSLNTSGLKTLYSSEANDRDLRPVLTIVWSTLPQEPTDLVPAGGMAVNRDRPVLAWSFSDPDGDDQGQYRVRIDDTADMSSLVFDTGWVVGSDQFLDLSTTAFVAPSDGQTRYWTVQVRDIDGNESPISDIASWVRDIKGSLALTSPGATTETPRPTISWTLTGETQDAYTYDLDERKASGTGWTERTGGPTQRIQLGTSNSFKLPAGLIRYKNRDYRLRLRVWDTKDRIATPGDPVEYALTHIFQHVNPAVNPGAPANLVVTQSGPGVLITWTRGTAPNFWGLLVDGEYIFDDIEAADLSTGGTNYAYTYYGARPGKSHTYEIVAIVTVSGDDKPSTGNPTAAFVSKPVGAWLIDQEESPTAMVQIVGIGGDADADFTVGEDGQWFYAIGRSVPIRVIDSIRGHEGSVSGSVITRDYYDVLMDMKERSLDGRKVRFVGGGWAFQVQLGEVSAIPHPSVYDAWDVSVEMAQTNRFEVEM